MMLLALMAVPSAAAAEQLVRKAQEVEATSVAGCQGEELELVTQGCDTAQHCAETAESMGLQIGSEEWSFEGDWADKGCIYYPADHELYPNQAYFGKGGSCSQLKMTPMAGAVRMNCDGTTRPPFDPLRCQGNNLCLTAEACRAAAVANGYQLGSDLDDFEGDYHVKGCVFYPMDHPEYPGQAYWGTGASICGQLRADPSDYDGSMRMTCGSDNSAEELVGSGIVEEGDLSFETTGTSAPTFAAPQRPQSTPNVTVTATSTNVTESDNSDAEDDPFPETGPVVTAFEGQEASGGDATLRHALGSVVASVMMWAMV